MNTRPRFVYVLNQMSKLTQELPRKTIMAWRDFAGTYEFIQGIDWLRHNRKRASGTTPTELIESAVGWSNYMDALDDVQDVLTELPKPAANLEEPGLND